MKSLRGWGCALVLLTPWGAMLGGQAGLPPCASCAEWNKPQTPFKIYGDTYYVGPHGLSSILIASDAGHVLMDGALPESAAAIASNIRALGFRIEDVKLIVNSHAHFDHAGGIAELQRLSGAEVVASAWSAAVLRTGGVAKDDPQYGEVRPIAAVARVRVLREGEVLRVGKIALTPHATGGHTPGGTSWTWRSCEGGRCLEMVYVDSVSAVSAAAYQFTKHPEAIAAFEKSLAFLDTVPCDILLTPHGDASDLWKHLEARGRGVTPDPLIDSTRCRSFGEKARGSLQKRLAEEARAR